MFIDDVEDLARDRAKELFGAEHANVQPHSGANANLGVYLALLEPGDTVLGMSLDHGGHLTHGSPVNASGKLYRFVSYGVTPSDERIDYDQIRDLAQAEQPEDDRGRRHGLPADHRSGAAARRSPTRSGRSSCSTPPTSPAWSPAAPIRARCPTPTSSPSRPTRRCAARAAVASSSKAEYAHRHRQGDVPRVCRAVRSST